MKGEEGMKRKYSEPEILICIFDDDIISVSGTGATRQAQEYFENEYKDSNILSILTLE